MPQSEIHWSIKWLRRLSELFAIGLAVIITLFLFRILLDWKMKKPITGATPDGFPVIVYFTSDSGMHTARVVELEKIEELKKQFHDVTYIIPSDKRSDAFLQIQYQADGIDQDIAKEYTTGRRMWITAKITKEGPDFQEWRIRYQHGNEHVNVGYYKATRNSITPLYLERYFGPGSAMAGCPIIALAWVILSYLFIKLIHSIPLLNPKKPRTSA